jgi:Cd2+/Zn2+-exporting ATPase
VLYALSEHLEELSVRRSRRAITSLLELAPPRVSVLREGQATEVEASTLQIGDLFTVRAGERIALDGIVTSGTSSVDQAPVTGESVPVEKKGGDEVFAGTLNTWGVLEVRASRPAHEGTVARIARLVSEADQSSPRQRTLESFARRYTPFVLVAAALTATCHRWLLV